MALCRHLNWMCVILVAIVMAIALSATSAYCVQTSCQVPNCRACAPDSEFTCAVCDGAEFILTNGQCSPRGTCGITACARCEDGIVTRCHTCESGYVRTANGLCASLVVCDMEKCAPQEELQSRVAPSAVECSAEEAMKVDGEYVCVVKAPSGGAVAAISHVPWWVYATATTAVAVGVAVWARPGRRPKAAAAA